MLIVIVSVLLLVMLLGSFSPKIQMVQKRKSMKKNSSLRKCFSVEC